MATIRSGPQALARSIEPRPIYQSLMNVWTGEYEITAELSDDAHLIGDPRPELYGRIMTFFLEEMLAIRHVDPQVMDHIRTGHYSFMFGEDGRFLAYSPEGDLLFGSATDGTN